MIFSDLFVPIELDLNNLLLSVFTYSHQLFVMLTVKNKIP